MTEVEITEYKTIEETKQRYECDHCGTVVDDTELTTVLYFEGEAPPASAFVDEQEYGQRIIPRDLENVADELEDRCSECAGLRDAIRIREEQDQLEARWAGIRSVAVNKAALVIAFLFGIQTILMTGYVSPEGSATAIATELGLGAIGAIAVTLGVIIVLATVFGSPD